MDKSIGKRARNFSDYEVNVLLSLVRKYVRILEYKKTDSNTIRIKNNAWQQIAREYNNVNWREPRSAKMLKEKYVNMKKRMRKATIEDKNSNSSLPYGLPSTPVEVQLKEIIDSHSQANGNDYLLDDNMVNAELRNNEIEGNTRTGKLDDSIFQDSLKFEVEEEEEDNSELHHDLELYPSDIPSEELNQIATDSNHAPARLKANGDLENKLLTELASNRISENSIPHEFFLEEHKLKMKQSMERHEEEMKQLRETHKQTMAHREKEHLLKMEIFRLEKEHLSKKLSSV